jgi:hypothetical protein
MSWWSDVVSGYNWLAKSHQQLYDDIHGGPGLGGGQGTVEHYDNADRMLQQIQQRIEAGVQELSTNWSGGAADGATALTRASADWANAAAVATINARGQSLHQSSAYVDTRNKMPEPVQVPDISPTGGFPAVTLVVDVARAKERAGAAHFEAARVMSSYESSTIQHIDALPQYPTVSTVVSSGVVTPTQLPPPRGGRIENRPGGGFSRDTPPQGTASSGTQPPGGNGPGSQPPPGGGGQAPGVQGPMQPPGAGDQSGSVVKPANGTTTPNDFPPPSGPPPGGGGTPFGVDIPRPGTHIPGTYNPGTQVPSAVPTGGGETPGRGIPGEGLGGFGRGPGSLERPAPGRGIPGEGRGGFGRGPGGVVEQVTGASRGAAGDRGAGGGSGMSSGAGRANREEDKEHQRKYVVLDDEHFLDDGPPVAPPVIGES